MKPLEEEIKTNGFIYNQEFRNNKFAIYSQWLNNEIIAYELIRIRKNKDRVFFGKHFEACESYPTNKEWGKLGWTFKNYSDAVKRLTVYSKDLRNIEQRVNIEGNNLQDLDRNLSIRKLTA